MLMTQLIQTVLDICIGWSHSRRRDMYSCHTVWAMAGAHASMADHAAALYYDEAAYIAIDTTHLSYLTGRYFDLSEHQVSHT